jgi:hypothetical protein
MMYFNWILSVCNQNMLFYTWSVTRTMSELSAMINFESLLTTYELCFFKTAEAKLKKIDSRLKAEHYDQEKLVQTYDSNFSYLVFNSSILILVSIQIRFI